MRIARLASQRGFTLVEALAAFAMLGLGLLALFGSISIATRGDQKVAFESAAMRLAQSKLEALGVSAPLAEGSTSGVFGDNLEWALDIEPYAAADSRSPARGYWAQITVRESASWYAKPNSLTLKTLKISSGSPQTSGQ